MGRITVYSVTVKFGQYSKTFFSEESYQDCWDSIYKFQKANYPTENITHIHSAESNYK